jgi:hypothetical protein
VGRRHRHLVAVNEGSHYKATPFLALQHEESDRSLAYAENDVRRRVLGAIIAADEGSGWVRFGPDDEAEMEVPIARLRAAARVLAVLGLIELGSESNGLCHCSVAPRGLQVYEDSAELERQLPTTPTHDEAALLPVTSDVLSDVIWTCEQLLERRGWDNALAELKVGDREYAEGKWVSAVRSTTAL